MTPGVNLKTNEEVAIKLVSKVTQEPIKARHPQLYYEAKLYKYFNGESKIASIQRVCREYTGMALKETTM
jgi:hypothetical protein